MGTYERLMHVCMAAFVVGFVGANLMTVPALVPPRPALGTAAVLPDGEAVDLAALQRRLSAVTSRDGRTAPLSSSPSSSSSSLSSPSPSPSPVPPPPAPRGPARVRDIMVSQRDGAARLAVTLSAAVPFATSWNPGERTLTLRLEGVSADGVAGAFPPLSTVSGLDVAGGGAAPLEVRIRLAGGVEPDGATLAASGTSDRVDLGLCPAAESAVAVAGEGRLIQAERDVLGEGLVYERHRYTTPEGAGSDVHVLRFDLASREFTLGHELGQGTIQGRERVSSLAGRVRAVAAVNASFFADDGDPLGLVSSGRSLLSVPVHRRSCFGIFRGSMALMGNPGFSGVVETDFGKFFLDGVNQKGAAGSVIVYTPEFGATTHTTGAGLEMAIADGRVVALQESDTPIPAGGFVVGIRGTPPEAMANAKFWDKVTYRYGLTPPWDVADFAVGGGPRLLADGEEQVAWKEERFARAFADTAAPRSAVGVGSAGEIVMAIVDGRDAPRNTGLSLGAMARVLRRLGCRDAINLDGGGSTAMWVRDRLVNRPSDGRERPVSSALVVTRRLPTAMARAAAVDAGVQGT